MVKVTYKGQNYILFGKTRIANGVNEISDEEFYRLMKTPTFASRVNSKILQVPKDFPLEKPSKKRIEKEVINDIEHNNTESNDDKNNPQESLSTKELLKEISQSKDGIYLKNLVDHDSRVKIREAARKKLESLNS
jgi:hypothetical protein